MVNILDVLLTRMLVSIAFVVLGVICNLWIVHINLKDRRQGSHLSPPDQILSFMALINAMMQIVSCFDMSSLATEYYSSSDPIHLKMIGVLIFLASCNIWFTAWLSIYYYLRIVNFTSRLFFVLKMRISKHLPKLMVVSIVESLIIALPSFWSINSNIDEETTGNSTYNSTKENTFLMINSSYLITAFLWCTVPLVLTLLPIGLTLRSLWSHMNRMNKNNGDSSHPQTQAHITAARTMVLLLTLHIDFHAVSVYILMRSFNFVDIAMICAWFFITFYPIIQALVMITGNSKLKKASRGLLGYGRTWCNVGKMFSRS